MITTPTRKAVIPAAGLGTRLLPVTKAVPKELLPIAGRPLIQFAVEEASASGVDTVILVLHDQKSLIAKYFDRDLSLEMTLSRDGRHDEAHLLRHLSEFADIQTVLQPSPLGLADAIRCARPLVGDEPFAVILPDALIDSAVPCLRQLMDCYEKHPGCILATQRVDEAEVNQFGILDLDFIPDSCCGGRTSRVTKLTERPCAEHTASRYGIFGRYILEPEIFSSIEKICPGRGGELQLTDALQIGLGTTPTYAHQFEGKHYDAGSKVGFLQATLAYSLQDPEIAEQLQKYLSRLELVPLEPAH